MHAHLRHCILASIALTLFTGCAPTFRGAILNGSAAHLDAVEYVSPTGKRLVFRDLEPYRMKTFVASWPSGDIRLFWKESSESGGQTYRVTLPPGGMKDTVQSGSRVLVMRIETDPVRQVRVDAVPMKQFSQSLLQPHGEIYPAVPVTP